MDDSQESSVLDDSQGQEQEVILNKMQKKQSTKCIFKILLRCRLL